METRFKNIRKKLLEIVRKPEMRILPGQLAFFLLLSIIPLIAVVAVMAARFNLPIEDIVGAIDSNLPSEIAEFIKDIININIFTINNIFYKFSYFTR